MYASGHSILRLPHGQEGVAIGLELVQHPRQGAGVGLGAEEEAQGGRGVLAGLDEAVVDGGGVGDGLEGEGRAPAEIACVGQGLVLAQDQPGLLPQDGGQGFAAGLDAGELGLAAVPAGDEAHVTAPPGGLPDLVGALGHLVRREEDDGDGPGTQDGVEGGRDVFPRLGADGQVEGTARMNASPPPAAVRAAPCRSLPHSYTARRSSTCSAAA